MAIKKYKIAIYSPIKDELKLKEWITYYDNLKIDLFILLDDFSEIPVENYFKELNMSNYEIINHNEPNWDYKKLTNVNTGSFTRIGSINEYVIPLCKKHNIDYILHVDADEFLYLNKFDNIQKVISFYEPFDELKINWLLFNHSNIKYNNSDSLINTFTCSQNYINKYTKSLTKVSSIINGANSHSFLLKQPQISKNIFNEKKNSGTNCHISFDFKSCDTIHYKNCPLFVAHYVYKSINDFVEKKCCKIDGKFSIIFNTNQFEKKNKIINFNNNNKENIVEYVYLLLQDVKNNVNIKKIEESIPFIKELRPSYLKYYSMYNDKTILKNCQLPDNFYSYHTNLLLKNIIYNTYD